MLRTFSRGSRSSNGTIPHDGVSAHRISTRRSSDTITTAPGAGSPHVAEIATSVDSAIRNGDPLNGPGPVPCQKSNNSCEETSSITVGKGATSAYTHTESASSTLVTSN